MLMLRDYFSVWSEMCLSIMDFPYSNRRKNESNRNIKIQFASKKIAKAIFEKNF